MPGTAEGLEAVCRHGRFYYRCHLAFQVAPRVIGGDDPLPFLPPSPFGGMQSVLPFQFLGKATLRSLRLLSFILRPSWATCTDTIWICSRPMSVCLNTI